MTIRNKLEHTPGIKKIESESGLVSLLQCVKADISVLDRGFSSKNLREVLKIIQEGVYEIPRETGNHYTDFVDLHKAQRLVTNYQLHSEGGCQSCRHYHFVMSYPDERTFFCGKYDDSLTIGESDAKTPRIEEYFKTGCDEKEQIFRPLNEVLQEH